MSEIRCHNGYCSFNSARPDCPICHGRGWHRCEGAVSDAWKVAGTPYDSITWAGLRREKKPPTEGK